MSAKPAIGTVALALSLWLGSGVGSAQPIAQSAHTITVKETASLHLVKKVGAVLHERGTATGTLPGPVKARFVTKIIQVTGSVTFYPRGGSLTINVIGYPRSIGKIVKLTGTMTVRGGTGRFAHAHGKGSFSATVNHRTWAATVHAKARLAY